ncbi:MAG TPA: TIGR02281 family clan AA aspartic protease [Stellaceae bacterium]|nr:TIGR02281 family clan AA aspartic protease [Stellaceae bacterium]
MRDFRDGDAYQADGGSVGGTLWWALRRSALWGCLAVAVFFTLHNRPAGLWDEAKPAAPAATARPPAPPNTLVYRADRRGHVFVDAAVNGAPIRFIVDTGATFVALGRADAAAAGIAAGDLRFNMTMNTANGRTRAASVTLREVRLGQLTLYDVPAVVHDNMSGIALLGMSFLSKLQSYEMRDGVLTITYW